MLLATPSLHAQQSDFHCGANELERMGDLVIGHPDRLQQIEQARMQLEHFTQVWEQDASRDDNQYIIPVVFHIVHNNGPENISNEQVFDGIRQMNEDFNKLNADWQDVQPEFLDRVADMKITFKLAQLDPQGNCTNGITRTVSSLTYSGDQSMKNLIMWPRERYLNIWVAANAQGAAGYSMYPSNVAGQWGAATDGIVVLGSYVGAIGTSSPVRSHTLSHEAGHWMNLRHCWGDSNDPGLASNCNTDDAVADTPNTKGWTSCNLRGESCGSLDNVENFMEYSYCSKMFTNGQKARVHAALNSNVASRNNLWSAANLALTGVNNTPTVCAAAFNSNRQVICASQSVTFTDQSYNGVVERNWEFEGGSPATAQGATATITYHTPGTYAVALTVGDGSQTVSTSQLEYITVLPLEGEALPFAEGFEGMTSLTNSAWRVYDPNGDGTFTVSSSASYSGSKSLMLTNTAAKSGNIDELYSPPIDITSDAPVVLSFRYAFAKRNNDNNDALRVYASRDCGVTWTLRRALTGSSLATVPNTNIPFVPNDPEKWGYNETAPIGAPYVVTNLMFKFVFESAGGNNLWLDDININGASVGIAEALQTAGRELMVVPNPATNHAMITAMLTGNDKVKVEVMDLLGRPVQLIHEGVMPAGAAQWSMDLDKLPGGMYFVRVQQGAGVQVAKFTKQ